MAALENASLSDEPALSGWWIVACLSAAGLILLFAALIQQASRLSDTLFTLFPESAQTAINEPVKEPDSETVKAVTVEAVGETELIAPKVEAPQAVDTKLSQADVGSNAEDIAAAVVGDDQAFEADETARDLEDVIVDSSAAPLEGFQLGVDTLAVSDSEPSSDDSSGNLPSNLPARSIAESIVSPSDNLSTVASNDEAVSSITDSESAGSSITETDTQPLALIEADTSVAEAIAEEPSENALLALSDDSNTEASASDELEAQPSAELSLASLRRSVLNEMNLRSEGIRFETGSSELTTAGERLLGQAFEDLFLYAEADIVIEVGSLDSTVDTTNRLLSDDRAQTIRDFLINRGIEAERLVISLLPDSVEFNEQQFVNIQANL